MRGTLVVVLLALGCDSKATASDPQSGGARAEQKSKEYESCGASMHCQDELRCFDHVCQRPSRSVVGDYYAAVGAKALAAGDANAAIAAYASALGHYDTEKVPLPPHYDCAYGAALAAGRSKKENAELGARVLHRCVLAIPAASSWRASSMTSLASLAEAGLDPLLIGAPKLADLYLTKGPAKPATDKLAVAVSANPSPAKSMPLFTEKLAEPDIKSGLVACWEQYNGATKKETLAATIGMKGAFVRGEFEDDPVRFVLKFEPPVALPAGPESAADGCVRAIVEPAIKSLKIAENFTTKLTVTIR